MEWGSRPILFDPWLKIDSNYLSFGELVRRCAVQDYDTACVATDTSLPTLSAIRHQLVVPMEVFSDERQGKNA